MRAYRGFPAAVLAMALLVPAAPSGATAPGGTGWGLAEEAAPGDEELVNFAHVYNFQTTGTPADGHATDLEFYTADVPKRNYETGELLDEAGDPLPAGASPVIVTRDFTIMGSYNGGAWVFDITDPESVRFVRHIPCSQQQNDVQIKQLDGRWILALARDGGSNPCVAPRLGTAGAAGIAVFDVTDPYEFAPMYSFRTTGGAHNFTFHPTKPYGWVSTGDLPGALNHIPIVDFTDVAAPSLAADIEVEGGPHDISFSPDGDRAYVASENNFRIYDSTDPKAPVLISRTPNAGTYAHGFDPTPDGKIAVGTNESLALGGFFARGVCPRRGADLLLDRGRSGIDARSDGTLPGRRPRRGSGQPCLHGARGKAGQRGSGDRLVHRRRAGGRLLGPLAAHPGGSRRDARRRGVVRQVLQGAVRLRGRPAQRVRRVPLDRSSASALGSLGA